MVLDNAAIHTGKENTVVEDYLWDTYGIFLLFLPARAPEWNPMEQGPEPEPEPEPFIHFH